MKPGEETAARRENIRLEQAKKHGNKYGKFGKG